MLQIVFNTLSAAEMSQIDTLAQLALLDEFKVDETTLQEIDNGHPRFGKLERDGRTLYRYRAKDYRLYFEVKDSQVIVHRVLHKNSLGDFLYRSSLPLSEDEALAKSKTFWKLIEEGEKSRRV